MNENICINDCPPGVERITLSQNLGDSRLALYAKALAHPARVQILRILSERKACICGDIVSHMSLAQSTVSEHLRILKNAGLISGEIEGARVCYCAEPQAFDEFKTLLESLQI